MKTRGGGGGQKDREEDEEGVKAGRKVLSEEAGGISR